MATIEEVYKVLKEKQRKGENVGIFGQSYIDMFENKDKEQPKTKEVDVSFIKNKNETDS
jgi:single-stranded DNA-binding protein|tara:strand:+ start:289 stop:465 length:177 start_codon:yes stop_codon:yes gene_type:complete